MPELCHLPVFVLAPCSFQHMELLICPFALPGKCFYCTQLSCRGQLSHGRDLGISGILPWDWREAPGLRLRTELKTLVGCQDVHSCPSAVQGAGELATRRLRCVEFNPLLPKLPHFQNGKMRPREHGVTKCSGVYLAVPVETLSSLGEWGHCHVGGAG